MADRREIPEFVRRTLIVLGLVGVLVLIAAVLWYAAAVPLLFFAGVLLAILIDVPARWVSRHSPLSRFWATGVVLLVFVGALVGIFAAAGPSISQQFDQLSQKLPQAATELRSRLEQSTWGRNLLKTVPQEPSQALPSSAQAIGQVTGAFASMMWALTAALVIGFTGVFLAFEPRLYIAGALRLVPPARRRRAGEVLAAIGHALRWWWLGRLATMTVDGVMIAVGLWLLGVPLALILGLLAAVLAFIPNLGPILSFIPAGLIALAQGPMTVLWVALLYLGVQFVESYMITPVIEKKAVSLPPALLLTAQVLMGLLAGILGLLVASPLTVAVIVAVQMLYIEDVLGERVKVLGEDRG